MTKNLMFFALSILIASSYAHSSNCPEAALGEKKPEYARFKDSDFKNGERVHAEIMLTAPINITGDIQVALKGVATPTIAMTDTLSEVQKQIARNLQDENKFTEQTRFGIIGRHIPLLGSDIVRLEIRKTTNNPDGLVAFPVLEDIIRQNPVILENLPFIEGSYRYLLFSQQAAIRILVHKQDGTHREIDFNLGVPLLFNPQLSITTIDTEIPNIKLVKVSITENEGSESRSRVSYFVFQLNKDGQFVDVIPVHLNNFNLIKDSQIQEWFKILKTDSLLGEWENIPGSLFVYIQSNFFKYFSKNTTSQKDTLQFGENDIQSSTPGTGPGDNNDGIFKDAGNTFGIPGATATKPYPPPAQQKPAVGSGDSFHSQQQ